MPGGSGSPRGGRNGRPCGGMLGGSPCPWGKPGGNLIMIIITNNDNGKPGGNMMMMILMI